MSDLQWKIEDGELLVYRKCGTTTSAEGTKPFFAWIEPRPSEAAAILLADRAATQEKCAQVANQHSAWARSFSGEEICDQIEAAIRALKMETGHE